MDMSREPICESPVRLKPPANGTSAKRSLQLEGRLAQIGLLFCQNKMRDKRLEMNLVAWHAKLGIAMSSDACNRSILGRWKIRSDNFKT